MKSFASFFAYLQLALATIQAVRSVEVTNPQTPGQVKADMVLTAVATAAASVPAIADTITSKDIAGTILNVSNATVATLNAAGVFKHGE